MPSAEMSPQLDREGTLFDLERYRDYLRLLARMHLSDPFKNKIDASDVVQQTLLEAHKSRDLFRGENDKEMAGWLRQILACCISKAMRDLTREKRDVLRERSLQAEIDASSARLEAWLAHDQTSPSQRVTNQEVILHLAEAIADLPDGQREALVLRYWQGWTVARISQHLGCSKPNIVGLIKRGTEKIRQHLSKRF